jgi:Tfp pilus assembly protein PilF
LLIACCLAMTAGCGGIAARGKNAEGVRLYQQARYQEAQQQFKEAVYADPLNADAYYNLAAVYHQSGKAQNRQTDLDQAENLYNQCLDHDPQHRECYRALAVLLIEQKRTNEAFRLIEGWADRQPTSADARIELARLFEEFGDKKAAKEHLLEALAVDPNSHRALNGLGKLREELGEQNQALANYQRSLWLNRFQPELANRVASLQAAAGGTAAATPDPTLTPVDNRTQTVTRDTLPRR